MDNAKNSYHGCCYHWVALWVQFYQQHRMWGNVLMRSTWHWWRFKDWTVCWSIHVRKYCLLIPVLQRVLLFPHTFFLLHSMLPSELIHLKIKHINKTWLDNRKYCICLWENFNEQSSSFLLGYALLLKTDDRFWNAFPICRYSFCNAVGLKAEDFYYE